MKKYELTENVKEVCGRKLFQIKALKDFSGVKAGELGGWIEKEENLSQDGNAWVCGDARVYGSARVCGDAMVSGSARVYGDAKVCGDAVLRGGVKVKKTTDYVLAGPAGSRAAVTTFVPGDDMVFCGCFSGTLEEFVARVEETHEGQALFLSQYRSMVHFFRWMRETLNVLEQKGK